MSNKTLQIMSHIISNTPNPVIIVIGARIKSTGTIYEIIIFGTREYIEIVPK